MSAPDERAVTDGGTGRLAPDAASQLVRVLQGVFTGVQGVVGEGASQALLRYGAFEEGKRLATERGDARLDTALAHIDRLFAQSSHATRAADGAVRIEIFGSPLAAAENPLIDTVLLGLYEGLLNGLLQARFKGSIERREAGDVIMTFVVGGS